MFYRPLGKAVAADVIPYYKDGEFYFFYLKDFRDMETEGEGVPWYLIKTKDFVNFTDCGEVLQRGDKNDQDLFVFTGSVIENNGKYYLFYTGHNPHKREQNSPEQCVMLATSDDCVHFVKTDFMYFAPDGYEMHDWRDPFVYKDGNKFKMLLAARKKEGPFLKRGLTIQCESDDLLHWTVERDFYAPNNYYTHECPDLFKMGDWWYLVFSEFSDRTATKYRMAKSLDSEWITPPIDTFDARSFYAAKTVSDGNKRYVIGWNPTRENDEDYKPWQWGGTIVAHEIIQNEDGTLCVRCPKAVEAEYSKEIKVEPSAVVGNVLTENGVYTLKKGGYSYVLFNELPENCKIHCDIRLNEKGKDFGLSLRMDSEYNLGYYVKLDPVFNRMCFDRNFREGDNYYMVDSERYLPLDDGQWHCMDIYIQGTVAEVYIDGVAMSVRMYDYTTGRFGVYANECGASFKNIRLATENN